MMTPLRFEEMYEEEWTELEGLLDAVRGRKGSVPPPATVSGARLAALYRRVCEHLALARARFYPVHLIDRLERLTGDAHQLIYYRRDFGIARLREFIAADFPRAIRQHAAYVAAAAAAFVLPTVLIGCLVYSRPELILSVVSVEQAASIEQMYSPAAGSIGRERSANSDWIMFGYYIRNNIGVAFQCFAGGLFAGIGSLLFLGYNGAFGGAVAGYLTERGLSSTFYSFVATHAAFELTAIVLAGAAGLRVGFALLDPGRLTRAQALVVATRESAVLLYGVTALLLVAAAVEAFWSSAAWLPHGVKYGVAGVCWAAMLSYCVFQGRRAD